MANINTINEILDDFAKFYDRKQSSAQRLFYEAALKDFDEDLLCRAIMRLKQHEPPNRIPSINVIRKYYFEEKDAVWQRQKARAPIFDDLKNNAEQTQHGREAIALMRDLSEGRLNREQYLAGMMEMEKKYPDVGWMKNAAELKMFWNSEPDRHRVGNNYFERIYADQDSDINRRRKKLQSQADWIRENLDSEQKHLAEPQADPPIVEKKPSELERERKRRDELNEQRRRLEGER